MQEWNIDFVSKENVVKTAAVCRYIFDVTGDLAFIFNGSFCAGRRQMLNATPKW